MPSPTRILTLQAARRHVRERCFASGAGRTGAEVEFLVHPRRDPTQRLPLAHVERCVRGTEPLPGGSAIWFEPGGQIELSSPPLPLGRVSEAVAADLDCVARALDEAGVDLTGLGLDPLRPDRRVLDAPRYAAMQEYFDADGSSGRRMMCGTAAIQVNLDAGPPGDWRRRWELVTMIAPALAAAFANSPFAGAGPSGWHSTRLATWWAIDASRTAPVAGGADPAGAWAAYAMEARVMLVRASAQRFVSATDRLSFAGWIERGHELGYPTLDDLDYHLTTLFPPVRPRGWLELRVIDAQASPHWRAAIGVPAVILDDVDASAAARRACEPAAGLWVEAARHGLGHPVLAAAARACFEAALEAAPRAGVDRRTEAAMAGYYERYVARARTPADDLLDAWAEHGTVLPRPERATPARRAIGKEAV